VERDFCDDPVFCECCLMQSIESYAKSLAAEAAASKQGPRERGWKARAGEYLIIVSVIYLILKDPKSPFLAKVVAALSIGYVFSPIQLIPSFIPVIGWLDDAVVLSAGMWLLTRLTPAAIVARCRRNAVAARAMWLHEDDRTQGLRTWRFLQ
jgi:uncharacterized membrane protein YkvA (DUF1232 family)